MDTKDENGNLAIKELLRLEVQTTPINIFTGKLYGEGSFMTN